MLCLIYADLKQCTVFKFFLVRKLQMTIQIWFNWKFPITPTAVIYFILYIVNRGMYCGTTLLLWFSGTMFTLELLFPSVNPYMYFKITFCCKTFFIMTVFICLSPVGVLVYTVYCHNDFIGIDFSSEIFYTYLIFEKALL